MSWGVALRNAVGLGLGGIPSLLNAALYPRVNFNFLSGQLDPRITFSRTSNATLIGSNGQIQYAPHNLLTYSEQFDNAAWTKAQSTITSNSVVAPDGTTTADKLVEDATLATHFTSQSYSNSNALLTFSIYIKAAERSIVRLQLSNNSTGAAAAFFDASSGTISSAASDGGDFTGSTATITSVGNGWYRCSLTTLKGAVNTTAWPYVTLASTGTTTSYTGDGTSGIYVWGAQLNVGALQPYYQTVASAYYGPRFDYDPTTLAPLGLLIEEQRTNSIRNNTMQGAVTGTPGTLPTNWSAFTALTGLTREVVGTGTETGINYIDIRLSGTPSAAGTYLLLDEANNGVAALTGQAWTHSLFVALAAGSTTGVSSITTVFEERTSANAFVAEQISTAYTITATALGGTRQSKTATTNGGATTAFLNAYFRLTLTGAAIDITLRIGLPQLELGAFATSVIPTSTIALTRASDVASVTGANFSSWYNSAEGTLFVEGSIPFLGGSSFPAFASVDDGTSGDAMELSVWDAASDSVRFVVWDGGSSQASIVAGTYTANTVLKLSGTYKVNDFAASYNGAAAVTDTSGTLPTVSLLRIGQNRAAGNPLNGHIRSFKYYPTRLRDSALQLLTR